MATTSKYVCVIGAGPAGLVATRELRREGHRVVTAEQSHDVGGQWLYDGDVGGEDPLGRSRFLKVHSSVYASLRLATPRETLGFSDFPFVVKEGRDTRRFPGHRELLCYLKDFCEWFGLTEMIRFNTRVEYVGMSDSDEVVKWVVRSRDLKSEEVAEEVFDAVVVATGQYTHPRLPSIKGMEAWKRKQMHSHIYRDPHPFHNEPVYYEKELSKRELFNTSKGFRVNAIESVSCMPIFGISKVVVVVGNSVSGRDISMELVDVAKQIHLSAKYLDVSEGLSKVISKHHNLYLHPQIQCLHEDGRVVFVDGSWVMADTIIYCTGYSYSFPFLDTKGIVIVDDDRVGPLYEHTFPPSLAPSLSFVGIPRKTIGFPFFESQAIWIAQLLSGRKTLPSFHDMMQSIEEFYQSRDAAGIPKHHTHNIANFEYCDKYGDNVGYPHLEEWRKELFLSCTVRAHVNLETFRDSWDDYELLKVALLSPHFTQSLPPPSQHVSV